MFWRRRKAKPLLTKETLSLLDASRVIDGLLQEIEGIAYGDIVALDLPDELLYMELLKRRNTLRDYLAD